MEDYQCVNSNTMMDNSDDCVKLKHNDLDECYNKSGNSTTIMGNFDDCVNLKHNELDKGYKSGDFTTIMDLPDDCLVFIFNRLSDGHDRKAFGLTCSRWLEIQNRNQQTLQFNCSFTCSTRLWPLSAPCGIDTHDIHRALTRYQNLRSLSLSGCTEVSDSGLKPLQSSGSCLRALHLDCCFNITDVGLSFIASGCPSLKFVSLYRCNVTNVGLGFLAESCLGLEDVNLNYCYNITDYGIHCLVQNCAHLYGIRINHCSIKGVGFHGCSQTLAYLEAESCRLEAEGMTSMVGLKYLNISNLSWVLRKNGLLAFGGGFAKMLQYLNMRSCRLVRDEDVAAIAKGCPALVEWNLNICHEIKFVGWESIALNCHSLERLHVVRCRNLCDRGLEALKNGCIKLSVLYMNGCPKISTTAIELFKLSRGCVIKEVDNLTIGPNWQSWWQGRIYV